MLHYTPPLQKKTNSLDEGYRNVFGTTSGYRARALPGRLIAFANSTRLLLIVRVIEECFEFSQ